MDDKSIEKLLKKSKLASAYAMLPSPELRRAIAIEYMKNIPKSLREKLEEVSFIGNLKIELSLKSKVDKTRKYLFE